MATKNIPLFLRHSPTPSVRDFALLAGIEAAVKPVLKIAEHFFLQPMDGPDQAAHTASAIDYCLTHPRWRLSVQTHKYIGVR